ncbi:MAG TPA: FAD-dependent oxidoreductase [Solirubrobacteraceae bacterium]|jgi:choline dehydrogenase-like flavoprotein|nr:FAD-dependent oxidoreductase [Solirubrobacteraceae bacterium]
MAVAVGVLSDTRRRALEAVCDTFAPSLQVDDEREVVRDFYGRSASDLGVAAQIEGLLAQTAMPEEIEAFGQLLDAFAVQDIAGLPLEARTELVNAVAASSPEAKLGVRQLRAMTFLFFYGLPDEAGHNPNWDAIGYPGPLSAPPSPEQAPKTIAIEQLAGESATLQADVCVVGSGAGGGVIAAELAGAGRSVVVLEMGGYRNEADFKQLELPGMFELYLGGGLAASEDGSIAILAGSTLGGGTVVNYMNCIRTPEHIRREWAAMGVEGIADPDYERHIDAIWQRLGVNDTATSQNRTHKKLIRGCEELGYPHRPLTRNTDIACEDPSVCGYCFAGCQRGCKQSTMKTFLQDAADAGARFVVGARAERILTEDGSAVGVQALVTHEDGSTTRLTVQAPTVVVAAGAVESPALLLRSGIGGPAAGRHLRLHPAALVAGVYEQPIEGWIGQIQSALSDEFKNCEGEHGFLVEATSVTPALVAMSLPWQDGHAHKRLLERTLRYVAPFISVARDHGEGQVVIDDHGRAVTRWSFGDEVDARMFRRAMVELARLQRAAGAREIITFFQQQPPSWREGEDFEAFLAEIERGSLEANDIAAFTAHQMGSCRMGSDPSDSVANGRGELHDTSGVWIGDGSAFPTAPGVNPMISIMSLAHRTAESILAAG